ncbi:hypothetical protein [Pedobacter frigiditerrae]|uniref:hypothetical protein n=1 Tax=Pedobacter frigiditerrae TaxID=2530452 RepID=UPI00292FD1A5|nr:hypothetical protein [Pedobacter frigiditerrae]
MKTNLQKNQFHLSIKRILASLSFIIFCINLSGAQEIKKNSLYVELGGNTVLYSVNYDRIIPLSTRFKLAPRVGFEYVPRNIKNGSTYGNWSFPIEVNLLYAKRSESKNFLEGGFGLSLFNIVDNYKYNNDRTEIIDTEIKTAKITTLRLGFRHQKPTGGFMYRAGLLVRLSQDEFSKQRVGDDLFFVIWPGASLGYSF